MEKFSTYGALLFLLWFKQLWGQLGKGISQWWHCAPGALPVLVWVISAGLPVEAKGGGRVALTLRSPTQSSYKSL